MKSIEMMPIGRVENTVSEKKDTAWGGNVSTIILDDQYAGGLSGLDQFSHAIILYYLDQAQFVKEKHLQRRPQNREDMPMVGIFSQRAKDRPNRIGMTSVEIVSVSGRTLIVKALMLSTAHPFWISSPTIPCMTEKTRLFPNGSTA